MSTPVDLITTFTNVRIMRKLLGIKEFISKSRCLGIREVLNIHLSELQRSELFNEAWVIAEEVVARWLNLDCYYIPFDLFPLVAIACYTQKEPRICRIFNTACRTSGATGWRYFPYKSLWCFLIMLYPTIPMDRYMQYTILYRGVWNFSDEPFFLIQQFTSATRNRDVALRFSRPQPEGALLIIQGLPPEYARDVSSMSTEPDQEEVLIWPLCYFEVTYCGNTVFNDFYDTRCFRLDFTRCYAGADDLLAPSRGVKSRNWAKTMLDSGSTEDGYYNKGPKMYSRNYGCERPSRYRPY